MVKFLPCISPRGGDREEASLPSSAGGRRPTASWRVTRLRSAGQLSSRWAWLTMLTSPIVSTGRSGCYYYRGEGNNDLSLKTHQIRYSDILLLHRGCGVRGHRVKGATTALLVRLLWILDNHHNLGLVRSPIWLCENKIMPLFWRQT